MTTYDEKQTNGVEECSRNVSISCIGQVGLLAGSTLHVSMCSLTIMVFLCHHFDKQDITSCSCNTAGFTCDKSAVTVGLLV